MGHARLSQSRQMHRPVPLRERTIRPAQLGRHALIIGAEVAHVQLVDDDVLRRGQRRPLPPVPALRLQVGVVEVDDLAAGAVHRQADRVRVGHQIRLHRAGAGGEDGHLVEVVLAVPLRLAGQRPHAGVGVDAHNLRVAALRLRVGVGKAHQAHALGRGGPDAQHRHAILVADAQRAVIGVEVVDHAGDLQAGGVEQLPAPGSADGHLPLQGDARRARAAGQMEDGVIGQVGEARG